MEHILREGNSFENYLANWIFLSSGKTNIIYLDLQDLPPKGNAILHLDKTQIPNLRIRNIQNRGFNAQHNWDKLEQPYMDDK